ncbi:MAG: AzlD domain-containing protein [Desulfamplus sp.]|nr:AzlD domain-containing protein [Desulfamplus sp.]MBF0411078.1 AzlD domain-containing protein [Desulfamplus sp.]
MNIQTDEIFMLAGMAAVTFGIRYIMLPISGRFNFSPMFERALKYVPPAVLSAIIVPSVLMPDGDTLNLNLDNPYIIGAVAACIVGWFYKNLLLTIVVSMLIFLGYQWIL